MTRTASNLAARVLAGDDPRLRLLAARGLLPLPPEELIPIQVALAESDDPELAAQAAASLDRIEPRLTANYLESDAGPDEIVYFARRAPHPLVIETIIGRRDVPRALLMELARDLRAEYQELLLLRQDAVVDEPAILDALEDNPRLSTFSRRRIAEYREHLLPRQRRDIDERLERGEVEEASSEEVQKAVAEAKARRVKPAETELEELTGLSEIEIRTLPVPVRLRLARGAPRALRGILLRDPNPQVAVQVLRANPVSDQEIEQICHSRTVVEEVLEEILRQRSWMARYQVVVALAHNPRTPLGAAVKLVSRLSVRDLRILSRDHNAADAVRATATRLYKIKRL